jgi:hypothetical protein
VDNNTSASGAPRRSTSRSQLAARTRHARALRRTRCPRRPPALDRVAERRRATALARPYLDAEWLPLAEIARRLWRAPATVKAYLYDPTDEKARAVKARYRGYCRNCGADTSPRNGKGDAYPYCQRCRPGAAASKWTHERVREAMRRWAELYGRAPSSYDWSRTHARRRDAEALRRLERGDWPASATVSAVYGTWTAALVDAFHETRVTWRA